MASCNCGIRLKARYAERRPVRVVGYDSSLVSSWALSEAQPAPGGPVMRALPEG